MTATYYTPSLTIQLEELIEIVSNEFQTVTYQVMCDLIHPILGRNQVRHEYVDES